jgi:hypothetical protein
MNMPMRYLIRKGNLFQVKIDIPADCRAHFAGKKNWVESTGTGDIAKAKVLRDQIDQRVKALFRTY